MASPSLNKIQSQQGLSIVDILIGVSIIGILVGAIALFVTRGFDLPREFFEQVFIIRDGIKEAERMADVVRNGQEVGQQTWLVFGGPYNIVLYSNVDSDAEIEKVRYFINENSTDLYRGITQVDSGGNYPDNTEELQIVVRSVRNREEERPLFEYDFSTRVDRVMINLLIDVNPNQYPSVAEINIRPAVPRFFQFRYPPGSCLEEPCVEPTPTAPSCVPGSQCTPTEICSDSGKCPTPTPIYCVPGTQCLDGGTCPQNGTCPTPTPTPPSCIPGSQCLDPVSICPQNGTCPTVTPTPTPTPPICLPGTTCPGNNQPCPQSGLCPTANPSASPTTTVIPSSSPTATPTPTITLPPSATPTPTPTPTNPPIPCQGNGQCVGDTVCLPTNFCSTPTPTPTSTPNITPTATPTALISPSVSPTPTSTPIGSISCVPGSPCPDGSICPQSGYCPVGGMCNDRPSYACAVAQAFSCDYYTDQNDDWLLNEDDFLHPAPGTCCVMTRDMCGNQTGASCSTAQQIAIAAGPGGCQTPSPLPPEGASIPAGNQNVATTWGQNIRTYLLMFYTKNMFISLLN